MPRDENRVEILKFSGFNAIKLLEKLGEIRGFTGKRSENSISSS